MVERVRLANWTQAGQPCIIAPASRIHCARWVNHSGGPVQFSVIALNVLYAIIGVVLMFLSYRLIDRLTPEVDFPAELQKGNVAVAIFIAAIFISIAMIIGKALG
jgi:putative membrane protein